MDSPTSSSMERDPSATDLSNPAVQAPPPSSPNWVVKKKKKKRVFKVVNTMPSTTSPSSSSSSTVSASRSAGVAFKRRAPKVVFAPVRRGRGVVEAIALPLGMSFAAVVAKVLEGKDTANERISVDHLSMICASAVRESLANVRHTITAYLLFAVPMLLFFRYFHYQTQKSYCDIHPSCLLSMPEQVFGDKFDIFARNFEKSFASTLSTLRLINESPISKGVHHLSNQNVGCFASSVMVNNKVRCPSNSNVKECHSETQFPTISMQTQMHIDEEVEEDASTDCLNRELVLHEQVSHLSCAPVSLGSVMNQFSIEQARSNDLKTMEIGLTMKKLKLKEAQLAMNFDANHLQRSKLELGKSRASFKEEKFKTELKDARHNELLKSCMDCLVAALFIMSASLLYGAYIFSHKRITQATASCIPSHEESKSWWIPRPFSSINSELHTLRCKVQVVSRMLFGVLMILAVAYLLLQRSGSSQQANPITFIVLLLGAACGFAGKLCVDTLGGSGSRWFLYWEMLCFLQFFANFWISALFRILYGPVALSQGMKQKALVPYWIRRILFYTIVLVLLPLCCGLLPFASLGEWKDHFFLLAYEFLIVSVD